MSIDISNLPAPAIIEQKSFEVVLAEMLNDLALRDPKLANLTPSDPAYIVLEVAAYRETLKGVEFNDRVKGLLLAFSKGPDLDHIGVTYYRTARLLLDAGDATAIPPVPATYESDEAYLERLLIAEDAYSTAGPEGAYIYHASKADVNVKHVKITSPSAVAVVVSVLSRVGDGVADAALLTAVSTELNNGVRPLTDQVTVQSAVIISYTINSTLTLYPNFDQETVRLASQASVLAWVDKQHRLGRDITVAAVIAAHIVDGVMDVQLNNTVATDIVVTQVVQPTEAAYCTGVTIVVGGVNE